MTNTYTMTNGETVTYKELQVVAKDFGIKANQKADVLIALIAAATKPVIVSEAVANDELDDEYEALMNADEKPVVIKEPAMIGSIGSFGEYTFVPYTLYYEEVEAEEDDAVVILEGQTTFMKALDRLMTSDKSASVASATEKEESPAGTKAFEFIRSNNLGVVFKQKGVIVKIGWNPSDARPYIKVGEQPRRVMMIQSAIDKFKPFKNGVHGDVAQIVKALVRIRKMPAQVLATQKQRQRETKAANEVSRNNNNNQRPQQNDAGRKESTSKARYSGTIDASWLAQFRTEFETNEGRKPTGLEIRDAYINREA